VFSVAQDSLIEQNEIQLQQRATYIYNFTKYIEWEGLNKRKSFTIGVYHANESELVKVLREYYASKSIKGKPVEVLHFKTLGEIVDTDILYFKEKSGVVIENILPTMYRNNTLVIAEGYPFRQSMVNFIEIDNEFHFEINKLKINKAQLLVDPALLEFSIQSTADWKVIYDQLQEEKSVVESQKVELDKLGDEIIEQELELKVQNEKLKLTLADVKVKQQLLYKQDSTIQLKNDEIFAQLSKLGLLNRDVQKQLLINEELSGVFEKQEKGIADQGKEILSQNQKISDQNQILIERKQEIGIQEDEIKDQKKVLNKQLSQIEEQRLVMYAFITLIVFAVIFIFFMYRSNRRRKISEKNLYLKNIELSSLNDSLDSFTYRVSHDLKAPVLNVKNMIVMLQEHTKSTESPLVPRIVSNLSLSANRLESTIVDLLQLTRIERIDEVKSMIRVKDVLQGLLPDFENELAEINGVIDVSLLGDQEIYASDVEMTSIFQNLITNSIKYRSANRPLLIKISSSSSIDNLTLTYVDNGKGIDLVKNEGKLFAMFERFTSDRNVSGTGVGMYIIKKLVEKNRGSVRLESQLDNGLTYTIDLLRNK
jgi:signal transduction histidine kinase